MDKQQKNANHQVQDDISEEMHDNQPKINEKEFTRLEQKIAKLEDENAQLKEKNLRTLADYQNLVRRVEKEKQDWVKYANENLLEKVLDISDNLDRAAAFINDQGLNIVRTQMSQMLAEFGVKELEVVGQEFDPSIMECVDKNKGEKNKVLEVKQKGYMLHDKVLRPAKVVVGE